MADAISPVTPLVTLPYLTIAEYKSAPTAMTTNNLVTGNTDNAVQLAELSKTILRASAWIDRTCHQSLVARSVIERTQILRQSGGALRFHPRFSPVIALTSFGYGVAPTSLNMLTDCSVAWLEDYSITIPPNYAGFAGYKTYIEYGYDCGYVNTTIASAVALDMDLTVSSVVGIRAGMELTIADGSSSEIAVVASDYVYGATPVTLESALEFDHAAGVAIHAMPSSIKEACILAVTSQLKSRGSNVSVFSSNSGQLGEGSGKRGLDTDLDRAADLLFDFIRRF